MGTRWGRVGVKEEAAARKGIVAPKPAIPRRRIKCACIWRETHPPTWTTSLLSLVPYFVHFSMS